MDLGMKNHYFKPWDSLVEMSKQCTNPLPDSIKSLNNKSALPSCIVVGGCPLLSIIHDDGCRISYRYQSSFDGMIVEATLRVDYFCQSWELSIKLHDYAFNFLLGIGVSGSETVHEIEPIAKVESNFTRKSVASILPLLQSLHPQMKKLSQSAFEEFLSVHGFTRVFNYEWAIPCTTLAANWCAAEMVANQECLDNAHTFAEAWDYFNERLGKFQGDVAYTAMFEQSRQHYLRAIANELLNAYGLLASQRDKGLMGLRGFMETKCYDAMKALIAVSETMPKGTQLVAHALYKLASLHADFQANG